MITLIPKTDHPTMVTHFWPISLCNTIYKIISKVLVNRIKPILHDLIGPFQSAFIKGRIGTNSIILAEEILELIRKKKKGKGFIGAIKLDMEKAFDRLNWSFIEELLKKVGFDNHWRQMILISVTTVRYHILLNGDIVESLHPRRGLRQGDPLSPYLFILCQNVLFQILMIEEEKENIREISIGHGCTPINHLRFADDSYIFCRMNVHSCRRIKRLLEEFYELTGQKLNETKSEVFIRPNCSR